MGNKQHLKIPVPLIKADKHHESGCNPVLVTSWPIKGRFTHSMPCPCRAHTVPLPCSDSAVSFVKVRVVTGNIRSASPTI